MYVWFHTAVTDFHDPVVPEETELDAKCILPITVNLAESGAVLAILPVQLCKLDPFPTRVHINGVAIFQAMICFCREGAADWIRNSDLKGLSQT